MKKEYRIKYSKNKELCFEFSFFRTNISKKTPSKFLIKLPKNKNYNKIFCIGFGKTGTTSLGFALKQFGFKLGNQSVAEILTEDWFNRRVDRIIKYCACYDAFQDLPFAMPDLYKELDEAFPQSKFILTVRDSAEQWFNSLTKFHGKKFSFGEENIPTEIDLANAEYCYKGWPLDTKRFLFNYPNIPLYDKIAYENIYLKHNRDVQEYFKNRTEDLLVLNVAQEDSYSLLADFLNVECDKNKSFPWMNRLS